jgi:hypothetical protein
MADQDDQYEDVSMTVFFDALKVKAELDGEIDINDYNEALSLAKTVGDRRSHTFWGEFRRVWVDNRKKIVMWFVGLGTAITGAITFLFTEGALKIAKELLEKV